MAWIGSGTPARCVLMGSGISWTCLYAMATGLSPENGGTPVSISYKTTPSE